MKTRSAPSNPSSRVSAAKDTDPRLDSKLSWFVCISLSLATVFSFGSISGYGLFFPFILDEFGAGKARTAVVGSIASATTGIFGPVSTKICQQFGSRAAVIGGGLTCAVGVFVASFASSTYILYFTYALGLGFGTSLVYFSGFHILPSYFDRHRNLAMAIITVGPGTGLLIMTPVIQSLLEHFDWRKAMMILAAVNLLPCILGWTINRDKKTAQTKGDRKQQKKNSGCCRRLPTVDVSVLREPLFVFLSFIGGMLTLPKSMPPVHLVKMADGLHIPSSQSSWMYFISGISTTLARFLTGRLCDTGWFSLLHIFQSGVLLCCIANFLLPLTEKLEFLLVYACVIGFGEGVWLTSIYCKILNLFDRGIGWFMGFISIGELAGPPVAGLIADLSGSYKSVFFTAGAIQLLGVFLPFLSRYFKIPDNKSECECSSDSELEIFEKETVV